MCAENTTYSSAQRGIAALEDADRVGRAERVGDGLLRSTVAASAGRSRRPPAPRTSPPPPGSPARRAAPARPPPRSPPPMGGELSRGPSRSARAPLRAPARRRRRSRGSRSPRSPCGPPSRIARATWAALAGNRLRVVVHVEHDLVPEPHRGHRFRCDRPAHQHRRPARPAPRDVAADERAARSSARVAEVPPAWSTTRELAELRAAGG